MATYDEKNGKSQRQLPKIHRKLQVEVHQSTSIQFPRMGKNRRRLFRREQDRSEGGVQTVKCSPLSRTRARNRPARLSEDRRDRQRRNRRDSTKGRRRDGHTTINDAATHPRHAVLLLCNGHQFGRSLFVRVPDYQ